MSENSKRKRAVKKFAGIEVPQDLTRGNFFFMYLNTLFIGMLMVMPAIIQPAFLKDIIKVSPDFFGSINGFLQNMSQIATLAFVGIVGVLSDKVGRRILAVFGFIVLVVFYYIYGFSNEIAAFLHIPAGVSATICATLSFATSKSQEFVAFGPGLFVAYVIRLIIGIGLILCYPQFITMVADYTYPKDRGKGMAINGICMGLAALIVFATFGPLVPKIGVKLLFPISSAIALLGVIFCIIFLKDRMPEQKVEEKGLKDIIKVVNKSVALKASYLCSLITRADIVVMATFLISWAVQVANQHNMTSEIATKRGSLPMMVMSIVSFIAFPIIGILLDRWGRVQTIILTLLCGGVGLLLIAICPHPFTPLIFGAVVLAGFGMSGAVAGANTLAADASPKALVGSVLGGLNTMQPVGVLFFVAAGGYLFDLLGPGWAFVLKGGANLLLGIWMFTVKGRIKQETEEAASTIAFTMEWEEEAKKMLDKVPAAFRESAVSGVEEYARKNSHEKITAVVMEAYRKELGM